MSYKELIKLIEFRDRVVSNGGIYPVRAYLKDEGEYTIFFHVETELRGRRIKVETERMGYEFVVKDSIERFKKLAEEVSLKCIFL